MKLTMAFRSDPLLSFSADKASKTIALYLIKEQKYRQTAPQIMILIGRINSHSFFIFITKEFEFVIGGSMNVNNNDCKTANTTSNTC